MVKIKIEVMKQMIREARLALLAEEEEKLAEEVITLLSNVDILAGVEVGAGIERMTLNQQDLRADNPAAPLNKDDALRNAPDNRDGFVAVPRVLPGEDEENA